MVGRAHRCIPIGRSSVVEPRPSKPKTTGSIPADRSRSKEARSPTVERRALVPEVAGSSPAAPAKPKRGRPRIEDQDKTLMAVRPWESRGMSRSTWYRRQKENGE